jgi:hypothetical protein
MYSSKGKKFQRRGVLEKNYTPAESVEGKFNKKGGVLENNIIKATWFGKNIKMV